MHMEIINNLLTDDQLTETCGLRNLLARLLMISNSLFWISFHFHVLSDICAKGPLRFIEPFFLKKYILLRRRGTKYLNFTYREKITSYQHLLKLTQIEPTRNYEKKFMKTLFGNTLF